MPQDLTAVPWPVHTERLTIRPAAADDVDATWAIRRLPEVAQWITSAPADRAASWRLMERLGMRREMYTVNESLHRSGEWLDAMMYALLADEWASRPGRLRPAGRG